MTNNKVFGLLAFILVFNQHTHTHVYAQEKLSTPTLESIHVENKVTELDENNTFTVEVGNAVRIGGTANPENKVSVFIRDKTYEAVTKDNGSWFVLFSMPDLGNETEKVEALVEYSGATSDKVLLMYIKSYEIPKTDLQKQFLKTEGSNDTNNSEEPTNITDMNNETGDTSYVPISIIVLFLVLVIVTYLFAKKK